MSPMTRSSWLDRAIGFLAPQVGLRRMRARVAAEFLKRHYEAAAAGRRTQGWNRSSGDANAVVGPALSRLRDVARDLVRNNGYAESALTTIQDHVVGWGIVAKPKKKNAKASDLWEQWAETTACDSDGMNDFAGLQKLVMRTVVESGEVLVRRRFRRPEDGLPIALQLQVLDPDYLDTLKTGEAVPGGGRIVHGVEFNAIGQRVAYWLFGEHPGGEMSTRTTSVRVRAENILHVFNQMRPGQVRGASWFAPVLLRFKDFDEYEDATLMKQKIAACLAVITSDVDGTSPGLGAVDSQDPLVDSLEPGMILQVPPGRSIEVVQPPAVREYSDYSKTSLRAIATGLGITYEDLTGDYCMAPETRVLRADLRWVRADELKEGDSLVAFDEDRPKGKGQRRKWRQSSVVRAGRRDLPRVRVVTDRAAVTVSSEHMFLCVGQKGYGVMARSEESAVDRKKGYGHLWVRADRLVPGDRIAFLAEPWEDGTSHLHGYLKGIADGEGCVDKNSAQIGISQKAGAVCDEIGATLHGCGFKATLRRANGQGVVREWELLGVAQCLRFLGEVRPTRLLTKAAYLYSGIAMSGGKGKKGAQTHAVVISAEAEGVGPVVTLETTTHTVITEGLCSHNTGMPFSAARMSRIRHWDRVEDWRWRIIVPRLCVPVWEWAMQVAGIFGLKDAPAQAEWTAPPAPMVDPANEGLAYQRNIRTGIMTLSEAIRERGYDPETVMAEMAADNEALDKLGLVLDSDPRTTTQAGQPREAQQQAAPLAPEPPVEQPEAPPPPPEDDPADEERARRPRPKRSRKRR